jgi:hypothetical protein
VCERNKKKNFVKKNDTHIVTDEKKLITIKRVGKDRIVYTSDKNNQYNTNFSRLGPFLLSRSRCMISRIIEKDIDNIVRVHTDGFISKKELFFNKKVIMTLLTL